MAKASTLALDIQKEISILRKMDGGQWFHSALQRIEDAVNALAKNGALAAKGVLPPPPQIQQVSVKANGGLLHVTISDSSAIQKGINYWVEHDTDKNFTRPHPIAFNASRTGTIALPGMDDNGNPQPVYVRAYSQYPGGPPNSPIHFGGSGTAPDSGERGGSGFGRVLNRPTAGPKRVIAA